MNPLSTENTNTKTQKIENDGRNFIHEQTPLIEAEKFFPLGTCRVFLKMEAYQPSGSFKLRGIGHLCATSAGNGAKGFVSSSGGNAGMAAAVSAKHLNKPILVVVPESTPLSTQTKLEAKSASVLVHGKVWNEADVKARELAKEKDYVYIHPFHGELIWKGHASIMEEILSQWKLDTPPDAVILSCGGGGLLLGVSQGMDEIGWHDIPIIVAETRGADCLAQSLKENKVVSLSKIDSVAKSLGTLSPAKEAFDLSSHRKLISCVVDDYDAVHACISFADHQRIIVEPSCGASLSVVYQKKKELMDLNPKAVLVIVCGGISHTYSSLIKLLENLEKKDQKDK